MRNDDDRRTATAGLGDRFDQRSLAVLVKECVRLVQQDEARLTEQGASERHALRLARGQARAH